MNDLRERVARAIMAAREAEGGHYIGTVGIIAEAGWNPHCERALATKDHWRDPSRIEWVDAALCVLSVRAQGIGARSIAVPPPGCGNGGLDWLEVEPLVMKRLADFDLHIYAEPSPP